MPASRIPNLLHLLFFLTLTVVSFLLCVAGALALRHGAAPEVALADARVQVIVETLAYLLALVAAAGLMPVFWHRPFLDGIAWNAGKVRWWLAGVGLLLGFVAQGVTVFMPIKKDLPIEEVFRHPESIWLLAFFGAVVGPVFEEVVFRGFLLPALAAVVDWLRIPRDPVSQVVSEHLSAWADGSGSSQASWIAASIMTSLLFAAIHGVQLAWTWQAMLLLSCVSLVLCAVRIRTGSVAAAAVVHGSYNLSVFVTLFVATGGFRHLDRV